MLSDKKSNSEEEKKQFYLSRANYSLVFEGVEIAVEVEGSDGFSLTVMLTSPAEVLTPEVVLERADDDSRTEVVDTGLTAGEPSGIDGETIVLGDCVSRGL